MSNVLTTNPMQLGDTGVVTALAGVNLTISSVEWLQPTTNGHTAILLATDGSPICNFKCLTASIGQNFIKYFDPPLTVVGLNVSALGSGTLLVVRV